MPILSRVFDAIALMLNIIAVGLIEKFVCLITRRDREFGKLPDI
ncbi:MAG: hypothetical protein SAL07_24180 [Oscillatoria sp. PMC 1051.18]|nr:hypothetical protein [Oscillatoria sp. PMC 1050.18]MEC5033009.1 hypothetical protein [Oscillatoria sp. PMC 1051.18]